MKSGSIDLTTTSLLDKLKNAKNEDGSFDENIANNLNQEELDLISQVSKFKDFSFIDLIDFYLHDI
jgi:hypothetical protein